MESDLICNYKKCRKKLKDCAWVTSCSHVFCNDDGTREFQKALLCPACETNLPGKYDIIRTELNPSEDYKSMILAGLAPDIILDICSRAMSFWAYQMQQELGYQTHTAHKLTERCNRLEQIYEQAASKAKAENLSLTKELETCKQEAENHKKRSSELMEKLTERNRQLHKTQTMYENLRRKCISPVYRDKNVTLAQQQQSRSDGMHSFEIPLTTVEDIVGHSKFSICNAAQDNNFLAQDCQPEKDFPMRSRPVPASFPEQQNLTPMETQFTIQLPTPRRDFKLLK